MAQTVYCIDAKDNTATAMAEIPAGMTVPVIGESGLKQITSITEIPQGHKIALCDIPAESDIIKYGTVIGHSTRPIRKGEWVHLQNMASNYDERSSHLDIHTGAPLDTKYEV
jgi:altronate dehydratase small subunit